MKRCIPLKGSNALMHSRRIAFRVHPVSRTPSLVNRLRTKLAIAARDAFHERILALRAITADQIGAALDLGEQLRNVRGIVLQIAIDQNRGGAPRALQPGIHGRALAGIALELNQADLRLERDSLDRPIDSNRHRQR